MEEEPQPSLYYSSPPHRPLRRVPCDQCRQRRIRCDGRFPCLGCQLAKLTCKRNYVRKRPGRKHGGGKIITALRAAERLLDEYGDQHRQPESQLQQSVSAPAATDDLWLVPIEDSTATSLEQEERVMTGYMEPDYEGENTTTHLEREECNTAGSPSPEYGCSRCSIKLIEPLLDGTEVSDQILPELMKQCVHIYLQDMYPIMPILRPSTLRQMLDRPLQANENSMLLALCALVTTFMCRRSTSIFGVKEWEPIARYFLSKSLTARTQYDYIQDCSLFTLLTSFFLYTTHFELHNIRLCWFYLREAITLAQALGLHTERFYGCFDDRVEALYCRRIYCILFVTERSFAISRHKPALMPRALPLAGEDLPEDEQAEIDSGFRQLVQVYSQLGMDFIDNWSSQSDLVSSGGASTGFSYASPFGCYFEPVASNDCGLSISDTQKADIAVTQCWFELIFWQNALQHGQLSSKSETRSRTYSYPEDISLSLLHVLSSLSSVSVEVHGLGIFEKIFDVGNSLADVIQCTAKIMGCTTLVSQNLERLSALLQHLYLTPNSRLKYAKSLESRVSKCFMIYHGNSLPRELVSDVENNQGNTSITSEGVTLDEEKDINVNWFI